jgi:hypothetical protein
MRRAPRIAHARALCKALKPLARIARADARLQAARFWLDFQRFIDAMPRAASAKSLAQSARATLRRVILGRCKAA